MSRAHGTPHGRGRKWEENKVGCVIHYKPKSLNKSGAARAKDKLFDYHNCDVSSATRRKSHPTAKMRHSISDLLSRGRLSYTSVLP